MRKKMPKTTDKTPTFDVYKSIKDEIIEISELRFENILTKKFDAFRRDFKKELMGEIDFKFGAVDTRFDAVIAKIAIMDSKISTMDSKISTMDSKISTMDSKISTMDSKFEAIDLQFDSVNSKIETIKWSVWSMPLVMTVLMALFTLLLKFVVKI
jgi:hypothetical protein